ncbi:hypothetical protein MMC34_004892 [Xylographa carneopallida]|nr:hypothetical protein [Xylographa carneopallida]
MLVIHLLVGLLCARFSLAILDEIICHDNFIQRRAPNPGVSVTRSEAIISLMERAFLAALSPAARLNMLYFLSDGNYRARATLARLYATPQPLEHPITAAECLEAASLIPDSSSYVDPHNLGTNTRLNLVYPNVQRQRILQYRLDAILTAGNCAVQIIRRPGQNPITNGLQHADATAMALVVYPHARERALAVIQQCLSGNGGQGQHRFGYVGTKSVLNGLEFEYVVAVTLWIGDGSLANPGEHYYDRNGEIQAPPDDARGYEGVISFPYGHAFN